ncbi:MAG TPA: autotransporter domain-containing protein [Rhizobiaceae bacterium]|nr:autotransporter domain-containing protein [Rhizobiaceae bacterium]
MGFTLSIRSLHADSLSGMPRRRHSSHRSAALASLIAGASALTPVSAAAQTFIGGIGDWGQSSSWMPGTAPDSATAQVVFSNRVGNGLVRLNGGTFTVNSLTYERDAAWHDISGGTLRFDGPDATIDVQTPVSRSHRLTSAAIEMIGDLDVNIVEYGGLLFESDSTLAGPGTLTKTGAGTLSFESADNAAGVLVMHGGTLRIDGGSFEQMEILPNNYIGRDASDEATVEVVNGGKLMTNGFVYLGNGANSVGHATVSGPGSVWDAYMSLVIGQDGEGSLTVENGGRVNAAYPFFGGPAFPMWVGGGEIGAQGSGVLTVRSGGGVEVEELQIGHGGDSSGLVVLSDGGTLRASAMSIGPNNTVGSARLVIGSASTDPIDAVGAGVLDTPEVRFSSGVGSLDFNHTGTNYQLDAALVSEHEGDGSVNHYAGVTALVGNSSGFSGTTTVYGGTLRVDAELGGSVQVASGGTLSGSGRVGTTAVAAGGHIAPGNSVGTLTVDGNLVLSSGSFLDYELGSPGTAGDPAAGVSDRIAVNGDVTLAGTLNLTAADDPSRIGVGYYRLMTYGGEVDGAGLTFGTTLPPTSFAYAIETGGAPGAGYVDLYVAPAGNDRLQHWQQDGSNVWNADAAKWLNAGGVLPTNWAGHIAVFKDANGFQGGTILMDGSQDFEGLQFVDESYVLAGAGTLVADEAAEIRVLADSATIATQIVGSGSIVKTEAGTLILSGENSYQGGTLLAGGTIQVSSDSNLGAAAGGLTFAGGTLATTTSFASARNMAVSSHGALEVAANTEFNMSGSITGSGTLAKLGAGALMLSGSSEVDWSVQGGLLGAEAVSFAGDAAISDGAMLALNADAATSYAGTLSGTGSFTKTGSGSLNYTGSGSAFTGLTKVSEGLLSVNGALGGPVDVLSGGILGGNGTVGPVTVFSGGTAAPGNSIGTLNVDGDVTFRTGSTYQIELAGNGQGDLIAATGRAYVNGGTVQLIALDPETSYQSGQRYTILIAQGGVSGKFDAAVSQSPFLTLSLEDLLGGVGLSIAVKGDTPTPSTPPAVFTFAAVTPNQYATASALDTLGQSGAPLALYNALLSVSSADDARWAIDQFSGELHASAQSAFMEQSALIRGALTDRLRAAQGGVGASKASVASYEHGVGTLGYAGRSHAQVAADSSMPVTAVASPATTEMLALWTTGFGDWGAFGGNANAAGLNESTGGFLFGADATIGDGWRLGVAGGYSHSDFSIARRNSSGDSDNWHVGLYGGKVWGPLALRTGLTYTWQGVTTARSVAFPGYSDSLNADYDTGTFQAFGELGYRIDTAHASFEPYANLAYVSLDTGGYREKGGAAALFSDGAGMDTTFSTLGLRASKEIALGSHDATVRGAIGWRHAFGDITPAIGQAFVSSDAFTVTGAPVAENAAVVEAGFDLLVGTSTTIGLAYTGQFGDSVTRNGFDATLKVSF